MSINFKEIISNIFHADEKEKEAEEQKSSALQQKISNVLGINDNSTTNTFNPFLNKNGQLFNPLLNYQKLLDNPNISQKAKNYITQATGLSPTVTTTATQSSNTATQKQSNNGLKLNVVTPKQIISSAKSVGNSDSNIVNAAKNYIGTPYVWGGESMEEGGMDCSGFVYNALKDAGYDVGRTTAQGYRSYGKSVSKSDMQPGDLVFYGNSKKAGHIGIYIGNGQIIHSSGGSNNTKANPGKGVSIANVDYRNDFLEARRY